MASETKRKQREIDMLNAPFLKKLLLFAIPIMFTGVLQIVYNAADVIVVGRFAGKEALAAVGSTSSLVNLILNLFIGLATGTGVVTANLIGAGNTDGLKKNVHTAMLLSIICGFFVGIFGFFASRQFLVWMGSPSDVIELSTLYLKIYFLGAPASLVYNFGAAIIRSNGDTKRPLVILGITGLINVLLNLLLVVVFHLDVAGVAIATIVAQYISAVAVLRILIKLPNACRLKIRELKIDTNSLKKIVQIGIPAGIQGMMFSVSNVLIQSTINSFGSVVIAGNSAGVNTDNIAWVCMNAFSQASMTFASQNMGAKKYENISKIYWRCMGLAVIVTVIIAIVMLVFSTQIMGLFSKDPDVIQVGVERMKYILSVYFLATIMDVAACHIRGMGHSLSAMFITLVGSCVFRVFWIYVIFPLNPVLPVLYLSYPASWIVTFIALHINYVLCNRKILKETVKVN